MPNNILITPGSASIQFSGSAANTIRLQVEPSGSVAFYGNSGSLFSITDSLIGSLMSVNDISGLPILEVFSDDRVVMGTFNRNTLVVTGSRVGIDKAEPTADLDISGSVFITGSLRFSGGGITGSIFGTASNTDLFDGRDSVTFASTGSNTFLGNQVITGSINLSGSQTINSSGSTTNSLIIDNGGGNAGNVNFLNFRWIDTTTSTQRSAAFYTNGNTNWNTVRFNQSLLLDGALDVRGNIGTNGVTNVLLGLASTPFGTLYVNNAYISGSNTRLGIGKQSANDTVDILGNVIITGSVTASSNAGGIQIVQNTAGSVFNGLQFIGYTGGNNGGLIWNQATGEIRLNAPASYFPTIYSSGTERLRIDTSGRVGIGTTAPSATLDVNGNQVISGSLTTTGSDATINTVRVGLGAGNITSNTTVGNNALLQNVSGIQNVAVGASALQNNTTGGTNVAVGQGALQVNTIGTSNVAVGRAAINVNPSGSQNIGIGRNTLFLNTTGSNNTVVGSFAMNALVDGSSNIIIGQGAGSSIVTGSNNTIIGTIAGQTSLSNTVIIGAGSTERLRIDSSGNVGIGTSSPSASLHVQGNISASSYTSSISNAVGFVGTASFAVSASWAPGVGTSGVSSITAGDGLTGGTITSTGTITLDTSSVHFLDGVKKELNTEGVISSSTQFTSLTAPFTGSFTGSFIGQMTGTSSYAQNANLLDGLDSTIFATTGSNTFIGSNLFSGSVTIQTNNATLVINDTDSTVRYAGINLTHLGGTWYLSNGDNTSAGTNSDFWIGRSFDSTNNRVRVARDAYTLSVYSGSNENVILNATGTSYFSGSVGIGTTTTTRALRILRNNGAEISLSGGGNSDATEFYIAQGDAVTSYIWNRAVGSLLIGTSNTERIRVTETGRVGINTTNPSAQLHVSASGTINDLLIGDTTTPKLFVSGSGNVGIGITTGTEKLRVVGTFASDAVWTALSGVTNWGSYPTAYGTLTWDTGYARIYATSTRRLDLGANGANAHITITGSGDVGIGITSSFSNKLHVQGNVSASSYTSSISNTVGFLGTASWAQSSSVSISSSFATTASLASNIVTTAIVTASAILISGSGTQRLTVIGSGSAQPLFTVQGSQGELFSIVDNLSGSLFSVNDISGLPILEVFSDDTLLMGDYLAPSLNTTKRLTLNTASNVIYSIPTASYDSIHIEYNVKSGSNGRAGNFIGTYVGSSVQFTDTSTLSVGSTTGVKFESFISGANLVVTGSVPTNGWTCKAIIRAI